MAITVDNLEIQVKAGVDKATKSLTKLNVNLDKTKKGFNEAGKNANNFSNKTKNGINDANDSANKLKNTFISLNSIVKNYGKVLFNSVQSSMEYIENLNLFNVSMAESYNQALSFQYKMNQAFGTNISDTIRYQAVFQQMASAIGIVNDKSSLLSENLTKLGYDISSFYNIDIEDAMSKLQAGLAGQTKPLRSLGMDITQQSLQPVLESLGITDRSVTQLNQAEKMILRYITVLRQSINAQTDMARTIEQPANQLRILKSQLQEVARWFGNVFIGTLSKILPYINAIVMVIKELLKAIATLFGFGDYMEQFSGGSSAIELPDGEELSDNLSNAEKSSKKINDNLQSIDEIHNLNQDSGTTGGTANLVGGIDSRLLDALDGYDNLMDKVRTKASDIRDRIMEWLGFTKEINPITGEVTYKYQGLKTTLKNLWNTFKNFPNEIKLLMGLGIVAGVIKLYNAFKKLIPILGSSGLLKIIKSLLKPISSLFEWFSLGVKVNGSLITGLSDGVDAWRKTNIIVKNTDGSLNKIKTTMNGATVAVKGLITGAVGLYTVNQSMKNISDEGANLLNVLGLVGGSMATVFSGAQIGSIFGPLGTAIGGVTGLLLSLGSALDGVKTDAQKQAEAIIQSSDATREYAKNLIDTYNEIDKATKQQTALLDVHKNYLSELEQIVDANGKVKAGYEDRANFIITVLNQAYGTEMEMIDGVIENYNDEIESIDKVIKKKKEEILLQSQEEKYKKALEERAEAYSNLETAQNDLTKAETNYNRLYKEYQEMYEKHKDKYYKQYGSFEKYWQAQQKANKEVKNATNAYSKASGALDNMQEAYDKNIEQIMLYEGLLTASTENNAEMVDYYTTQIESSYNNVSKTGETSYLDMFRSATTYYDSIIRLAKENGQEITDEVKSQALSQYNTVANSLVAQTKLIDKNGELGSTLLDGWQALAQSNTEVFLNTFSKLPFDMQTKLLGEFKTAGFKLSSAVQDGINKINPKITFATNIDAISKKLSSVFGSSFQNLLNISIPKYATGGFPTTGSLFIAREQGAELVGNIGSQTAVVNNDQIVQSVSRGVAQAVSGALGSGAGETEIYGEIDGEKLIKIVVKGVNGMTTKNGKFPFKLA